VDPRGEFRCPFAVLSWNHERYTAQRCWQRWAVLQTSSCWWLTPTRPWSWPRDSGDARRGSSGTGACLPWPSGTPSWARRGGSRPPQQCGGSWDWWWRPCRWVGLPRRIPFVRRGRRQCRTRSGPVVGRGPTGAGLRRRPFLGRHAGCRTTQHDYEYREHTNRPPSPICGVSCVPSPCPRPTHHPDDPLDALKRYGRRRTTVRAAVVQAHDRCGSTASLWKSSVRRCHHPGRSCPQ
jgi:hypothetical protein